MSSSTIRQHYYRHPLYDKMVDEWDLFNTYVDFFVFAGSVGYATIDKTTAASYDEAEFAGEGEHNKRCCGCISRTNKPTGLLQPPSRINTPMTQRHWSIRRSNWKFSLGMRGLASNDWPESSVIPRVHPRDGLISFIENQQPSGESDQGDIF